ncbi:uncharacterized protein DSM5745_08558 [Aspergillus mulundensis]|uniref:Uncharacterized protein n=1 Tax=Aspergillus mulundensis TaxID=1810919 RepID=A0A3D8R4A9_9EURO|nr:hypothetical protein DSM5745_08558 [Aspergillus mulundensis]RDW68798.1 hypothetical protein DSM5745_08558 [Aspergillus mulundensis]
MNTAALNQIWTGFLPPNPGTAAWATPPFTPAAALIAATLLPFTRPQLLDFMRNPLYTVPIFMYGRTRATLWGGVPINGDEATTTAWYFARFPPAPGAPPTPQPAATIHAKLVTLNNVDPIEWLIHRRELHALDALYNNGFWDPWGYGLTCTSYLEHANRDAVRPRLIVHYICYRNRGNRAWALERPYNPSLFAGNSTETHLDMIINDNYRAFPRLWACMDQIQHGQPPGHMDLTSVPPGGGAPVPVLGPAALETLAAAVGRRLFTALHLNNNLDLTLHVPDIWHSAVDSRYPDVILAINRRPNARAIIDQRGAQNAPPLQTAFPDNWKAFCNLLSVGADADLFLRCPDGIPAWPHGNNKWKWTQEAVLSCRRIDPQPGAPVPGVPAAAVAAAAAAGQVVGGTLLHVVVDALMGKLVQVAGAQNAGVIPVWKARSRRRALYRQARELIMLVKTGCNHGSPSLATLDENGRTARDLARHVQAVLSASGPRVRLHTVYALL